MKTGSMKKIMFVAIFGLFILLVYKEYELLEPYLAKYSVIYKGYARLETRIVSFISEKIYPALQKPYENEAPPTPSSFPASAEISAVIGGKGEGLNCSLPVRLLTESLFFNDQTGDEAPISLQFRQACAFHDYCYRHGAATYGYKQVDCDFMLQEYAYRLCKQIFTKSKPNKPLEAKHEECMSRARRVLLGVRIGGGGSFMPEGKSTYFEFDPIPANADDYNVSRLVTFKDKITVGNDSLKKSVVTYRIKRGTVITPHLLTWKPCPVIPLKENDEDCLSGYPYVMKSAIATPPRIIEIGDRKEERLIANARASFSNTMVYLTEYPIANNNKGLADITVIPNKETDKAFDHDSSIRLLRANKIDGVDGVELLSFSNRPYKLSRDRFNIGEDGKLKLTDKNKIPEIGQIYRTNEPIGDLYRLLQVDPIIGKFLYSDCEYMLMINRGEADENIKKQSGENKWGNKGNNYETTVRGYFASLNNPDKIDCNSQPNSNPVTFNLDEKSEPFAAVPIDKGRDGLLSIRVNPDVPDNERENEPLTLELRDLSTCNKDKCASTLVTHASWLRMQMEQVFPSTEKVNFSPESLDASWVRMPVQVLFSKEKENSSLLFFSRILCSSNKGKKEVSCSNIEKEDYPETVKFEFEYHRLTVDSNKPTLEKIGKGSCLIDLGKQREAYGTYKNGELVDGELVTKIKRVKEKPVCGKEMKPEKCEKDAQEYKEAVIPWIYSDFANRWNSSQVIPGRIFNRDENSDILDVAVIFKDYVGFSLLLKGNGENHPYQLDKFSPEYISCDNK